MHTPLPLFPLNTVVMPGVTVPLHIFEPRYRALVRTLLEEPDPQQRAFGLIGVRDGRSVERDGQAALFEVGVLVTLDEADPYEDGRFDILTTGRRRFRPAQVDTATPVATAAIIEIDDPEVSADAELAGQVARSFAAYRARLGMDAAEPAPLERDILADPTDASYALSAALILPMTERQALLETADALVRLRMLRRVVNRELGLISALAAIPAVDPILTRASAN